MQEEKFNKQDGNLDQPNVNESLALAGLFRMVSVKERLPKESGVYWIIGATPSPKDPNPSGIKFCSFFSAKENDFYDNAIYWLEEVYFPTDDDINVKCKDVYTDDGNKASYWYMQGIRWVQNFVLAGKAVTAKDNVR